jgi:hypothetical protein
VRELENIITSIDKKRGFEKRANLKIHANFAGDGQTKRYFPRQSPVIEVTLSKRRLDHSGIPSQDGLQKTGDALPRKQC